VITGTTQAGAAGVGGQTVASLRRMITQVAPAWWENIWVGFYDELKTLVDEVANRVDRWSGPAGWTFEPGSSAAGVAIAGSCVSHEP